MSYEDFIKLLERDFWDYAAIIAPLVLSVIAIAISIYSIQKQNKISLFDKRYRACDSLFFLMSVVKQIADGNVKKKSKKDYLDEVIEAYKSFSIEQEVISNCKDSSSIYVRLIFESGKIGYLFKSVSIQKIIAFLKEFDCYASEIYKGNQPDEKPLIYTYNLLVDEDIQGKLEKQLRL